MIFILRKKRRTTAWMNKRKGNYREQQTADNILLMNSYKKSTEQKKDGTGEYGAERHGTE